MSKLIDLTGQRYGNLTVIKRVESSGKLPQWLCRCDCGTKLNVLGCNLRTKHTQSCGCLRKEKTAERSLKHGLSEHALYGVWNTMRQRCLNPKNHKYKYYGGRGITVCEEWRNSFEAFYNWAMNNGYSEDLTIDRIDNDGNYEPSNCRWATQIEQQNNRSNNKIKEV